MVAAEGFRLMPTIVSCHCSATEADHFLKLQGCGKRCIPPACEELDEMREMQIRLLRSIRAVILDLKAARVTSGDLLASLQISHCMQTMGT